MPRLRSRKSWLQIRVAIYLSLVAVLFLVRSNDRWRSLLPSPSPSSERVLQISGRGVAPELVDHIVADFLREFPSCEIRIAGGGTAQALEDLINRRADVAILNRPPTSGEQQLFRSVEGDSARWFPIALGGIALFRRAPNDAAISLETLRDCLLHGAGAGFERLYVPDPNLGLWDALAARLDVAAPNSANVVFVRDIPEVLNAVRGDLDGVGVVSTLALAAAQAPSGLCSVPVRTSHDSVASPTYEEIGAGAYPLHHFVYLACLARGGIEANMFITQITSARGQRRLERAGFLPARRVLREVVLGRGQSKKAK